MKRQKLKKLIISVLTVMFIGNNVSTVALASSHKNTSETYEQLLQSLSYEKERFKIKGEEVYLEEGIDTSSDEVISVIVKFASEPLAVSKEMNLMRTETLVDRDHRRFNEFIEKLPSTYDKEFLEITNTYKTVYNGVSMRVKASMIDTLIESGVVKAITLNHEVTVEPIKNVEEVEVAEDVPETYMMDTVPYLNIDELHEAGITGKGIKVGVLDTGIDYNHPDLTNVYKGFREKDGDSSSQDYNSVLGWDFVDNDADPMETTYDDWVGTDYPEVNGGNPYYTAHGTHVSGTIAGQADNGESSKSVLGVAPDVELYGYRVLGPYGSGGLDAIIGGMEKSVEDGMDVINMSLGNANSNSPYDALAEAANNASLAGVVTVIAAGNAGSANFTISSPSTAQLPIVVGASTKAYDVDLFDISVGENNIKSYAIGEITNSNVEDILGQELDLVYCEKGFEENYFGKDVNGKVVLVDRGDLAIIDKIEIATQMGAVAVVMINNTEAGEVPYIGENPFIPAMGISLAEGEALIEAINGSEEATKVNITDNGVKHVEGDKVTGFSSVGPTKQSYEIRPDVIAPGELIYSTVPEWYENKVEGVVDYNTAYGKMSGTSMATPHVAGIAALILQQNKEYTTEDVKAALMNTAEKVYDDNSLFYSVHEAGAGRVNPLRAVYGDVFVKGIYDVTAGDSNITYKNVSGGLSFGKLIKAEGESVDKTISVTVENNSSENKTYEISTIFSNSNRATNAEANGVNTVHPTTITVNAGDKATFDVQLNIPVKAVMGTYEGYIHINGADKNDSYLMPFSGTATKDGFVSVEYDALNADGSYKGLSGFTSSQLLDRHPQTHYGLGDIAVTITINENLSRVHAFVKDIETGDYIGYTGGDDASWIEFGVPATVENLVPNGTVKRIIDGKISYEEMPLETGIYELEIIAETFEGKYYTENIPMAIINEAHNDEVKFNFEPGVYVATEDMFTEESWFDGNYHEGIWITANVKNSIVEEMKNIDSLSYLKQNEVNNIFVTGYYPQGYSTYMESMASGSNDIRIAGVEKGDLKDGYFNVRMDYVNAGKIFDKPYNYTFVKENESYASMSVNDKVVSKDQNLEGVISLNNIKDVVKGNFTFNVQGDAVLDVKDFSLTDELKGILKENNSDIKFNITPNQSFRNNEYTVDFEITGGTPVGLSGNVDMFNVELQVTDYNGFDENLSNDGIITFLMINGLDGTFENSIGENAEVHTGTIFNSVGFEYTDKTFIYGYTSVDNMYPVDTKIYAVSPDGKEYLPTKIVPASWGGKSTFLFDNLPVIDGDYRVMIKAQGALKNGVNVPGGRKNAEGNLVGNTFGIISLSHFASSINLYSGDINGDGAIDIHDAIIIGEDYVKGALEEEEISTNGEELPGDINNDGAVNLFDMEILIRNYLLQDLATEGSKTPEKYADGRDLIDILESCGYLDEYTYYNAELSQDKDISKVGETVKLTAIPPTDEVEFEYEFAVREKADSNWTIIQERSYNSTLSWSSEKSGDYEFKVRLYFDDIGYRGQDNLFHTVVEGDNPTLVLDKENLTMKVGDKTQLMAALVPSTDGEVQLTWTSSDNKVVTVENGMVTAMGKGEAVITVATADGLTAECKVVVSEKEVVNPGEPEDPTEPDKKPDPDKKPLPETGALIGGATLMSFGFVAVVGGVLLMRKKKEEKETTEE